MMMSIFARDGFLLYIFSYIVVRDGLPFN